MTASSFGGSEDIGSSGTQGALFRLGHQRTDAMARFWYGVAAVELLLAVGLAALHVGEFSVHAGFALSGFFTSLVVYFFSRM
ncbi:MAG TPA: hypothetical protein VKT73_16735 [Xanthobacteraceae bacterium]|nr:hypothetical protein [Xanthobacteraceae bacterium]